ncbi:glycoside hydrolase family 2 [Bacillus sp. FJAT-26390]|uniref:glycoside hydrolase family 2 n=1 Tax=Bacillus sp. FJAT-26390 TaxID=1743142 RepID=UPI000807B2B0|nr:glycoside hydrolase family 2 [Bacillus sp. FJAT-26390]OBZ12730.1 hypothetical protein A7975_17225 [Bacillus sp. FJAT-26390]
MKRRGRKLLYLFLSLVIIASSFVSISPQSNRVSAAANPANLALGKTVTASSSLSQHSPSYMVDGSMDTMWSTSDTGWQTSPITDEWAIVDLGESYAISRWVVKSGADGALITSDYQLEYSTDTDNGPWITADAVTANTNRFTDRLLDQAVNARYVRLHVTKKTSDGVDWPAVRIGEFELYEAAAAEIPVLSAAPASGTVAKGTKVTLTSSVAAASIYYTTDGSDPTSSSSRLLYNEPLTIDSDITIKAAAIDELGSGISDIQTLTYQIPKDAVKGNLALGKSVSASSFLPQHSPSYMTDGSMDTMWSTSDTGWQSSPYTDEWAVVDLGESYAISRWIVKHAATGNLTTRDFQLEYSTGNGNGPWQAADSVTNNTAHITDRMLADSIQARYVRLHVTKKSEEGSDWPAVRIGELELYSESAIVPQLTASPGSGQVIKGKKITLNSTLASAAIYYTVDGSDPTTSNSRLRYSEPLTINSNVSLKVVAIDELGGGVSDIQSLTYTLPTEDISMYPNLARGATATMTVEAGWGNVAGRAIDGNFSTYAQPEKAGVWDLIVDLGSIQAVNYAVLRKNPDHQNYITQFTIDVSDNGTDWSTVVTENSNTDQEDKYYKFPVQNTRFVRLHQLANIGLAAAVWEFELYNTSNAYPVQADVSAKAVAEGTRVGLHSVEPGASIYYTTDGSDPLISETKQLYTDKIALAAASIDSILTLKAYAKVEGKADSLVRSFSYQVIAIAASPEAGIVDEHTAVALSSSVAGAEIYYTTDGTEPIASASKQLYSNPIIITKDMVIRAYVSEGGKHSTVINFPYSIGNAESNVAIGKAATASSEESANGASKAVDGNAETAWAANTTSKGQWLQVDLGGDYELTGTAVTWRDNKNYKYKIEVSSDSINWYPAVDQTAAEDREQVRTDRFLDAARRYVRITITDFELGSKAAIAEFEVLGYPSEAMPTVPVGPSTNGWARPVIAPLPDSVIGVQNPIINLGGTWNFTQTPEQGFWKNSVEPSAWPDAKVPANLEVLGFDIRGKQGGDWFPDRNIENVYKKSVPIPQDYQGQKVMLRFEAAFNVARIWVNGQLVRVHRGGFTTFDCDITDYVTPGESAWVTVGITAEKGFVEYQHVRGLTGEVKLFALPVNYLTRLHAETLFDDSYTDAMLKVSAGMIFGSDLASGSQVELTLIDPDGELVPIEPGGISLDAEHPDHTISIPVSSPEKWDAEHPNLYKLIANVKVGGEIVQTVTRKIGFRSIKIVGNKMLVNGKEVKLRGVNWHQSSPSVGVAADPEHDKESLRKLKDANVNYIRTSHWPQAEYVLDYADELGLYVEQENSVMFINDSRLNDAHYLSYFMGQFSETIEKDRSHPSIVIWSLENESGWGSNVAATHDYVKAIDPTRVVKSSFGYNAPSQYNDLFSVHYVDNSLKLGGLDKPEIVDEYAHLYVYYEDWFNADPSFEDFYGEGIKRLWDNIYHSEGALGGAIWHSRDLTTYCETAVCGFRAEWGIMDSWNREKPEYWNVKKAYSPIRINASSLPNPGARNPLSIEVENRYNHTNLNEIKVEWTAGNQSGTLSGPSIEPMSSGHLMIPARAWKLGDIVGLKFYQSDRNKTNRLVDAYNLTIGEKSFHFTGAQGNAPAIKSDSDALTLTGQDFKLVFSKATGMIQEGTYKGETIITGGPYLNMGFTSKLGPWTFSSINSTSTDSEANVTIAGSYGQTAVVFTLAVDGSGLISTTYSVTHLPSAYDTIGVAFDIAAKADRITWDRSGLWSAYPEDQIGRNTGTAYKARGEGDEQYGVKPTWAWSKDEKNFSKYGKDDPGQRGTADFVASKNNFNFASLILGDTGKRITAQGDGHGSVKSSVNADGTIRFEINSIWSHPAAFPGWVEANSISKPITLAAAYTNTVTVKLDDQDDYTVSYADAPTYLTDLNWASATTGWGYLKKDSSIQGNVLTLFDGMGSKSYKHGLGTHSNSEFIYNIDGKGYESFEAFVGVDQESGAGKVTFEVWADGQKLFDSDMMDSRTAAKKVNVNIAGKRELKLIVTDGGNGTANDNADWADAKLFKRPVVVAPSSEAALSSITVNNQALAAFESNKLSYDVALPAGTQTVPLVTAVATDSEATVKVIPAASLPGTTSIEVLAEDGVTKLAYAIHFTVTPTKPDPGTETPTSGDNGLSGGSKEQQIVSALQVSNGKAVIAMQTGVKEVLIPLQVKELNDLDRLIFKGDELTLELPKKVIGQLIELAASQKQPYISFAFTKLAPTEVDRLLKEASSKAHAVITSAGQLFELSLAVTGLDHAALKQLTAFAEPITLSLSASEGGDSHLNAIYNVKGNGELEHQRSKRINGKLEAQINHFSVYGVLSYKKSFIDVPSHYWAANVIEKMVAQGVVTGVNATEFAPQAKVTRAQFITMLVRALGLQTTGTTSFTDLEKGAWYESAVVTAYNAGIATGRSSTRFAPHETITREEMAVMIVRAYEVKTGSKASAAKPNSFADDKLIHEWARSSVNAAFELGILQGAGGNRFQPQGLATRAESVQAIAKLVD